MMAGLLAMTSVLAKANSSQVYVPDMWATVTSLSPLQVVLDNDINQTPRDVTANAVGLVTLNLRVTVEYRGTDLIIKQAPRSPIRISIGADLNNYIIPGQYYNPSSAEVAGFTNAPPNNQAGALEVLQASGVIQYWHDYNTGAADGNVYRRRYYAATSSWSAWTLYAGPATIQTGSNSNGNWAWFPTTGLTFCWMEAVRTDIAMNTAYGSLYQGTWRWDYPRAFNNGSAYPVVSVGQFKYDTGASWGTCSETYQSYSIIRGLDVVSRPGGANVLIKLSAIGYSW